MTTAYKSLQQQPFFQLLSPQTQIFLDAQAVALRLSVQDCRLCCEMALDFQMWGGLSIQDIWPQHKQLSATGKALKQRVIALLQQSWQAHKAEINTYPADSAAARISAAAKPHAVEKEKLGLGRCPVASPRTLCCNLQTLDAVDNCGYGCSYCSIQSFFDGKQITFDKNFSEKLERLELDPMKTYHIGTGQSSDSLMWGNSHGILDGVIEFARAHPNVILELKTKSANVGHLLRSNAPKNMLCTWSLNTSTLIQNEEHGTASLDKRLSAARKVADAGFIVGFHFHPLIHYSNWQQDYSSVIHRLTDLFDPSEVALVSLGTLTYIKSVMRDIRRRAIPSQILKMPMVDAEGKLSYPDDIKQSMFSHVYQCFPDAWKEQVFFYLCMENQRFWKPVFGFDYASNDAFEAAMKSAYMAKITSRR